MSVVNFLELIVCPETKQKLDFAPNDVLSELINKKNNGHLITLSGTQISHDFDAVLVREDKKIGYIVRDGIPVLLSHMGIEL